MSQNNKPQETPSKQPPTPAPTRPVYHQEHGHAQDNLPPNLRGYVHNK